MSKGSAAQVMQHKGYEMPKKTILGMSLLIFVIVALVAMLICGSQARYARQTILGQQRDVQQTWLDKSLDSIRNWRNELVEQARYISTAELFRLFVIDSRDLPQDDIKKLSDPDSLHSDDETLRSMA